MQQEALPLILQTTLHRPKAVLGIWSSDVCFWRVVNRTTPFGMAGGKLGVMGEAGPEAILPLKRGANGNLGVQAAPSNVIVNVNNQTGAEATQTESTNANGDRVIDILIINKVKEGFSKRSFR